MPKITHPLATRDQVNHFIVILHDNCINNHDWWIYGMGELILLALLKAWEAGEIAQWEGGNNFKYVKFTVDVGPHKGRRIKINFNNNLHRYEVHDRRAKTVIAKFYQADGGGGAIQDFFHDLLSRPAMQDAAD